MKTMTLSLGCLMLVACGGKGAVDLGGNSGTSATSATRGWANTKGNAAAGAPSATSPAQPQTIYDGGDFVRAIAVDETTIAASIQNTTTFDIRIDLCRLADCQGTLQTLYTQRHGPSQVYGYNQPDETSQSYVYAYPDRLVISRGEVIWSIGSISDESRIMACPVAGCPDGPRSIAHGRAAAMAANADFVFWVE